MRKLSIKIRQAMTITKEEPFVHREKDVHERIPATPASATKKPRSHTLSPEAAESLSRRSSSSFFGKRVRSVTSPSTTRRHPSSTSIIEEQRFHSNEDDVFLQDALDSLQKVLGDRARRHHLINLLLEFKSNNGMKIRFCCAVDEMQDTANKTERLTKAKCIVKLFVDDTALFHIDSISPDHAAKLVQQARYEYLVDIKIQLLEELARDDNVMEACRKS